MLTFKSVCKKFSTADSNFIRGCSRLGWETFGRVTTANPIDALVTLAGLFFGAIFSTLRFGRVLVGGLGLVGLATVEVIEIYLRFDQNIIKMILNFLFKILLCNKINVLYSNPFFVIPIRL